MWGALPLWLFEAKAAATLDTTPAAIGGAGHPSMRHAMRQARRLASRALEALLPSATPAVEQERTDGRPD